MGFALGPVASAAGYRLAAYETIGSTNAEALARARAGDPGRLWITAGAQTEGRGRRGRAWQTPSGNLAASLFLRLAAEPGEIATLGFAAGLALDAAIRVCAPELAFHMALDGVDGKTARLRLKWPNDVLVDGAKVAGILLQAISLPGGMNGAVIGFGINVRHAPEGLPYPATSLAACGSRVSAEDLFAALSDAWLEHEALWNDGRGFAAVRERWLERAAGLGAPIGVSNGEDVFRGTFETIDAEGRLVVRRLDGSVCSIAAGDVHFGAVASAGA